MLIGELAKRTGFSRDTIRWYEKIGLIKVDKKSRTENNYRNYDQDLLNKFIHIKQYKSFGFTLKEMRELFFLEDLNEINCGSVSGIIEPKLKMIDQKIKELQNIKSRLSMAKSSCSGDCKEVFDLNSTKN